MNGPEPTDKVTPEHVRRVLLAFVAIERKATQEDDAPFPSVLDSPLWHATDMCDLLAEAANDDFIVEQAASEKPADYSRIQREASDLLHSFAFQVNGERYDQARFSHAADDPAFVQAFIRGAHESACRLLRSPLGLAVEMGHGARVMAGLVEKADDPKWRGTLERVVSSLRARQAEAAKGKSLGDMAGEGDEWAAITLKYQRERTERVVAQAGTLPLHFSSDMPVPAAAGPDVILVHPEATPEELASAMWMFLWAIRGVREDGIEMEAALRPLAAHALQKYREEREQPPGTS